MNQSLANKLVLCDLDNLLLGADGNCRELVHFGYQDFKMRLGVI